MYVKSGKHFSKLEYVFALFTILNYTSVYYHLSNILVAHVIDIVWELLLFYFFYISIRQMNNNKLRKLTIFSIIFFIVCGIFLILYYIYYSYPIDYFFIYLIDPIMLITIFMSNKKNNGINKNLLIIIENVIIIFSLISIFFWVIYTLGIQSTKYVSLVFNKTTPNYFYLDFFTNPNKISFLGINMFRNSGIFLEPSIYAYMLCIALLIELFIRHDINTFNKRSLTLLVSIITTTSTTGILIALPIVAISIIIRSSSMPTKILLCTFIPIVLVILKLIFTKKVTSNNYSLNSSYYIRQNDIYASLKAWGQHPLIGNGLSNGDSLSKYMYSFRGNGTGSFTGFLTVLAYGGIPYSLFFILPTIFSMKYSSKILIFSIFSFILFIFTSVQISYIYITILSFLWACALVNSPDSNCNNLG